MTNIFDSIGAMTVLFLILAYPVLLVFHLHRKRREKALQQAEADADLITGIDDIQEAIDGLLALLNTSGRWTADGNMHTVHYDYQGGHFEIDINTQHPVCRLSFPFFYTVAADKIDTVRIATNHCNLCTDRCRIVYTTDNKKAEVDVHIMTSFLLTGNTDVRELTTLMDETFAWRNCFQQQMATQEAYAQAGTALPDPEKAAADDGFINALLNEQLMAASAVSAAASYTPQHGLSVGTLMDSVLGLPFWQPVSLVVTGADARTESIAAADIARHNVLDRAPDRTDGQTSLALTFLDAGQRTRHLVVHVQPNSTPGTGTGTRYFRVTALLVPAPRDNSNNDEPEYEQPQATSFIAALDTTAPAQALAKMRYLYKEAAEAFRQGHPLPKDDSGNEVAFHPDQDVFNAVYWGSTLFHARRYAEAVAPLTHAFRRLNAEIYANDKRHIETFYRTCRMLGFSHSLLRHYDEAVFYLEILSLGTLRYAESALFIHVMQESSDLRLLPYLDNLESEINERLQQYTDGGSDDDDDDDSEAAQLRKLLGEVLLAKAHMLTDRNQMDEASAVLEQLRQFPELDGRLQREREYWNKKRKAGPGKDGSRPASAAQP